MELSNVTNEVLGLILCESETYIFCVLLYFFLISLTVITVGGNLLVIISIAYFKQLHTPTNYLILSLAVADLLMGALIFPCNIAFSLTTCLYSITLNCKIRSTFDFMISIASILNLLCISFDRYYAVCQPLIYKSKITENTAVMMSVGTWVLTLISGIMFFSVVAPIETCTIMCFLFLCILGVITFYLPAILLMCIYFKIFLVAQSQARSVRNLISQSGPAASKKEKKATKTLAIVMGLFLMCWLPLYIAYPFQTLSIIVVRLIEPLNWLALSNSMFNPFIYAFFYSWFRSAFRMIISGKIFQGDYAHAKLQ